MSDSVQNEIIEMLAHLCLRKIQFSAQQSLYYGVTADGTTDISGNEQFSVSLQYVDNELQVHSDFLGFYNAPDSTEETLTKFLKDVFLRQQFDFKKLQGFCFDGACNMSGKVAGVQSRLKQELSGSIYVHCYNHL